MVETNILSRVQWFDQKKGYGFVKRLDTSDELFIHFSEIQAEGSFKKVFPTEYVEVDVHEDGDRFVGKNIKGVQGQPLMVDHDNVRFKYFNIRVNDQEE